MRYAIGIDLGGTNIAAGVVDGEYRLLCKDSVRTRAERPWQEVVADMAALVRSLIEKSRLVRTGCGGGFQPVEHVGFHACQLLSDKCP